MKSNRPGRSAPSSPTKAASAPDAAELVEAISHADTVELGARIRQARQARSLTQSDAAAGLISAAYLSRIESGDRRPELKVLRVLAERLGTTVHEWLLGLTPKQWSERRVELDWAQLSLRTGDALGAIARIEALQTDLPPTSRLYRRALFTHALALEATGDYNEAAGVLEGLVENETEGAATLDVLTALSRVYRQCGELGRAIEVGDRADRRIADLGMRGSPEAVKLTLTVAAAYCESGDVGYASRLCQKALKHAENLRTPNERAGCYWNASIIESERGNHAEAVLLGQKALMILDEAESTRNTARLRTELGLLHLRLKPPHATEALAMLRGCEPDLVTSESSPADLASNRLGQANAHFLLGDLARAQAQATDCLALASNSPMIAAESYVLLGQIAFEAGDQDHARALYQEAILMLNGIGADRSAAQLWYELGGLWRKVGRPEEALDAYERAAASTGLRVGTQDRAGTPARSG